MTASRPGHASQMDAVKTTTVVSVATWPALRARCSRSASMAASRSIHASTFAGYGGRA